MYVLALLALLAASLTWAKTRLFREIDQAVTWDKPNDAPVTDFYDWRELQRRK